MPLFFGVDIEVCSKCGGFGTPDEFERGVCSNCILLECFEALGPLEGFDDLGLERSGEYRPAMLRQAECRSVSLDLDGGLFDVPVLVDGLALRGTVIA